MRAKKDNKLQRQPQTFLAKETSNFSGQCSKFVETSKQRLRSQKQQHKLPKEEAHDVPHITEIQTKKRKQAGLDKTETSQNVVRANHKKTKWDRASQANKEVCPMPMFFHGRYQNKINSKNGDDCKSFGARENDYDYDQYSTDSNSNFEVSESGDFEESDYKSESYLQYELNDLSGSDPDYELPANISEDLIIKKGSAQKCELREEDNVEFDTDTEEAQTVELLAANVIKQIKQPKAYRESELFKLNEKVNFSRKLNKMDGESLCPKLVPISLDAFHTSKADSDCRSSEMLSDESSLIEEYLNHKYIQHMKECNSDGDEQVNTKDSYINVAVIDVKNCAKSQTRIRKQGLCLNIYEPSKTNKVTAPLSEILTTEETVCHENCVVTGLIFNSEKSSNGELLSDTYSIMERVNINDNCIGISQSMMESIETNIADNLPILPLSPESVQVVNVVKDSVSETLSCISCFHEINENIQVPQIFRSIFINAVDSNLVLVLVKDPFYLYGTVCLTLLAGKAEIYGYLLKISVELEVFSPRGCSSIDIASVPSNPVPEDENIWGKLKPFQSSFSQSDLKRIEKEFEIGRDAILLLRRNIRRKNVINIFKRYMNENVFPNMNSIQTDRPLYASEYLLNCVINTVSETAMRIHQEWQSLYFALDSKVIVVGGKSVGKSTLLRYLLNRQLDQCDRVLVIDLDIGQGELFVPQTVSCTVLTRPLLGPGFFLNQQPIRAYVVGHNNIMLCAQSYMRAVKKLVMFCYSQEEFKQLPWLVNTMGYNKGFGMEVIKIISQLIQPTDIVQLQSNREINNFDELLHPHILSTLPRSIYTHYEFEEEKCDGVLKYRLVVLNSAVTQESRYQREWEMSAKDLRYATLLARLSDALQSNAEWLTDSVPLSASLRSLHLINMLSTVSTREELIKAIEGNLVYLCNKDDEYDGSLECFGIGLVRAIDLEQLYLLPAMPYDRLHRVNCLALGEMTLPSSIFTNQGPKVRTIAAFLYNTFQASASKSIKQIYYRSSKFLTGKHKKLLGE